MAKLTKEEKNMINNINRTVDHLSKYTSDEFKKDHDADKAMARMTTLITMEMAVNIKMLNEEEGEKIMNLAILGIDKFFGFEKALDALSEEGMGKKIMETAKDALNGRDLNKMSKKEQQELAAKVSKKIAKEQKEKKKDD